MSTRRPEPVNPCLPDPCGPFSQCRNQNNIAACSCLPGYVGVPPNCRPECVLHSECPSNLACISEKCRDPCPGACGPFAECEVINHNAVCRCQQGYQGDPFTGCRRITTREYSMNCLDTLCVVSMNLLVFKHQYHPSEIPKIPKLSVTIFMVTIMVRLKMVRYILRNVLRTYIICIDKVYGT